MTTPRHTVRNWICVLEYWGDLVGPLDFWLWFTFKFPFFLYPIVIVSRTYEYCERGLWFRGKVPSSTYSGDLVVVFTGPSLPPPPCPPSHHPLSPRWMHTPFPWCSSFINIFFNCGIRELALWSYLQTQCYTTQPSLVTESWKRSDLVPKAGLGSDVPASVARFSLWTWPISQS